MEKLKIKLFGPFSASFCGVTVSERDNRTRKQWRLIKYIAANRDRRISREELYKAVGLDPLTRSPSSFKTLLHRARATLDQLGVGADLIVQRSGRYYWNGAISTEFDTDEFDSYIKRSEQTGGEEERNALIRRAISLYSGFYLDRAFEEIPELAEKITGYHIRYIELFEKYCEYLSSVKDHKGICETAARAIAVDAYQEAFHYHLIKAHIDAGDHDRALFAYNRFCELFYGKYRLSPPRRIRGLYRYILKTGRFPKGDIRLIADDIVKTGVPDAPLCAGYDAFLEICSVSARRVYDGSRPYLFLFSLDHPDGLFPPTEQSIRLAMTALERIIKAESGAAVYTRYSLTQLACLIFAPSEESAKEIKNKLCGAFESSDKPSSVLPDIAFTDIASLSE